MEMRVVNIMSMLNNLPDIMPPAQHAFVWMAAEIGRYPARVLLLDAIAAELHDPFYDDRREIFRGYMEDTMLLLDLEGYSFTNAFLRLGSRMPPAI